jgi:hypothetical protein
MNKLNQTLSEVLDVEPIDYQTTEIVQVKTPVEDDAEFARANIRDLISKGNSAIDTLLQVANASEHPRAYEVAAGLIKNLGDLNKDLLEIQKRKRDLDPTQSKNNSTTNIDKAVFVGSTTELVKFLKNNK